MGYEGPQLKLTGLTASASLTAKQYYFVKMSGVNTVTVCAATTDKPIGVLQNAPASGAEAEVVCMGQTKISADGELTAGASIGTSADGQAAVYTVLDTTKYIVGQMIESAGAADGIGTAVINCASIRLLA